MNSAFRTASHNAKQKKAVKYSQHLYGKAADIWIAGVSVTLGCLRRNTASRQGARLDDTTRTVLSIADAWSRKADG
ncbi:MAG: D-Ala-D-Ala carboxypeptidase family metallohydrolase [Faecalibacterium sp.]